MKKRGKPSKKKEVVKKEKKKKKDKQASKQAGKQTINTLHALLQAIESGGRSRAFNLMVCVMYAALLFQRASGLTGGFNSRVICPALSSFFSFQMNQGKYKSLAAAAAAAEFTQRPGSNEE